MLPQYTYGYMYAYMHVYGIFFSLDTHGVHDFFHFIVVIRYIFNLQINLSFIIMKTFQWEFTSNRWQKILK